MKLSGLVFVLVGIVVAVVSFFMVNGGQKMKLFMYAGIAMAVFGAWRIYMDRDEPPQDARRAQLAAQLPTGQRHFNEIPRVCSHCHTKNHARANFCGNCGQRL